MLIVGDGRVRVVRPPASTPRMVALIVVFAVFGVLAVVEAVLGLTGMMEMTDRTGQPLGLGGRAVVGVFLSIVGVIFLCGAVLGARRLVAHKDLEALVLDATEIRTPLSTVSLAEVTSIDIIAKRPGPIGTSLRGTIQIRTSRKAVTSILSKRDVSAEEFARLGQAVQEAGRQHGFAVLDDQGYQGSELR